ncbi:MAG: transposase [Clostridia bacterium]|nr:transposase [Clostridia bacterium]
MADANTAQLNTNYVAEYNALILGIMSKYDITTPEGQEQFSAELAAYMAEQHEISQNFIDGQATTIHRYEVQHTNLVKENAAQMAENKELKDTLRTYDSRLRFLDYWKEKAADNQKKAWALQSLCNSMTQYINAIESGKRDNNVVKSLRAEIKNLLNKIEKLNADLTQKDKEILNLERVNDDSVNYADAQIAKIKADAKRNEERLLAYANDLEASVQNLTNQIAILKKDGAKKDKKIAFYEAKKKEDYKSTGNPSSKYPNKPVNTRKKSDKEPGAQKGHPHYPRKSFGAPTEEIHLETPDWIKDNPTRYRPLGTQSCREVGDFILVPIVKVYMQDNYMDKKTGKIVHGPFPDDVPNEVNYGPRVKAFSLLMMDRYNVSVGNAQEIFFQLSDGVICPSTGFLSQLCNEFALKTKQERENIIKSLNESSYLNADFTFGRLNGKQGTVLIITNGEKVFFQNRPSKGQAGIDGTMLADYEGDIVSDNESALKKLGKRHQQCLAHVIRYLINSQIHEKEFTWNKRMENWVYNAITYWVEANESGKPDPERVSKLDVEYDEILQVAAEEYKDGAPNKDFRAGINLYKRMSERKEEYTLFMYDLTIPPTNNAAEIMARKFKRKCHQAITFRSLRGFVDYLCGLSVLESFKADGLNLYSTVTDVFNRPKPSQPRKPKKTEEAPTASDVPYAPVNTGDLATPEKEPTTV